MSRAYGPARFSKLLDAAIDGARIEDFGWRVPLLVAAQRRGLPVVDTWVLPAAVFRDAASIELPPGHEPADLIRSIHKTNGLERTARARERIVELTLPEKLRKEISSLAAEHGSSGFGLALRASPTLQDDTLAEAAGLTRTLYGVRSATALERGILELWALVFDDHALSYLREQRVRDVAMAVVVQSLAPIRANVLVQCGDGPRAPDERRAPTVRPESHVMAASLGLGSPLREGTAPRDMLRVAADGSVLARRLASKPEMIVVEGAALVERRVDPGVAAACSIDDAAVSTAVGLARKLDSDDDLELELLQNDQGSLSVAELSRSFGEGRPDGGEASTVWSRTGIADITPSVPTPLTASVVERFCESSLRGSLNALGAEVPKGPRLLGRARGRYYLNVSALVPAVSGVPGVEPAIVLELLRGADPARIARAIDVDPPKSSIAATSVAAARLLLHQKRLGDAQTRFEREAEQQRRWLAEMDLAILPDDSLVTTLRETGGFLETTGELLLKTSIVALAAHLALEAVLARVVPDSARHLAQALGSGVAELESVRPALALAHVAEILRGDEAAAKAVLSGASSASDLPVGSGRRALEGWLDGFGERGLVETEAISPRFAEDHSPILRMLRAGLNVPAQEPEQCLSRVRSSADSEMASLESRASSFELMLIRALLSRARAFARLRERMRVWMARTMSMLHTVTLDVDRRLRRLDPRLEPGAAFFLTERELLKAVARTRADLGPIVRMRRSAHQRDLWRADPPDTFVGVPSRLTAPSFDGRVLRGSAASGGTVTGRVRHVGSGAEGAENLGPGDIVVLRVPDPGLAPLYFWAAGVIADAGSALSHAAVIAREVGTPAVFGVVDAWTTLREGEEVKIDADRGIVERLAP